jgi:hypothetical protein
MASPRSPTRSTDVLIAALALAGLVAHADAPTPTSPFGPGSAPVAIVVPQPGLRPQAYSALLDGLEAHGITAVLLDLPTSPGAPLDAALRPLLDARGPHPVALVGHGFGGRAMLETDSVSGACGVGLLGVPLVVRPAPWLDTLPRVADHPAGIDLRDAREMSAPTTLWPVSRPESGYRSSWLGRISADWLHFIVESPDEPARTDMSRALWVGVSPLDELAPPESLGRLPDSTEVSRWGMLRGWKEDATAADLLTDPRPVAHLARWIRHTCA